MTNIPSRRNNLFNCRRTEKSPLSRVKLHPLQRPRHASLPIGSHREHLAVPGCATRAGAPATADEPPPTDNPYLAAPDLSRAELGEFLRKMLSKPASIRKRPGFDEAILDAADRILATDKQDEAATPALVEKMATLQRLGDKGDKKADERLAHLADELATDTRPAVADAAGFYQLERKALDADAVEPPDLPPLLAELKKYCQSHKLDGRHLRLASATVRIINRLPDDMEALDAYRLFGGWFADSEDTDLSRYGRKIGTGPKRKAKPDAPPAEEPEDG